MRFAPPAWKPILAVATVGVLSLAALSPVTAQTNNAPTPVNDAASTTEDTAVTIAVLSNDTDPDGNSITIASVGTPANGTATISGNSVVYTPKANFNGNDAFVYTVTDGSLLASAQVAVVVTPVNDAPVAKNDTANVTRNTPKTIDVLSNDTDVDGNALTVVSASDPAHGSTAIAGNKVTYTPDADYVGSDTFTYVVSDGTATATGTVTITVKDPTTPINDFSAKVLAACTSHAAQPGMSTLCNLYQNNDNLPHWARYVIGKNILKIAARSGASDRVLAACTSAPAGGPVAQLCTIYQNDQMPSWLRSQVGKLILKLSNGPSSGAAGIEDGGKKKNKNQGVQSVVAFGGDDDRKPAWLSSWQQRDKDKDKDDDRRSRFFSRDRDDDDRRARFASWDRDDDDRRPQKDKGKKGRGFGRR